MPLDSSSIGPVDVRTGLQVHLEHVETCGVCPQCGKNWEDTQCLTCQSWSRHADWYHELVPSQEQQAEVHAMAE